MNLKDGSVYTVSADIAGEVAALESLLNGDDGDNAADRVTGFFDAHDGAADARHIADLADLNGQIANSIVTRDIDVTDATPQLVSLTPEEVDRLGEGSVQIKATQTDGAGNLHEGGPATSSFMIPVTEDVSDINNQYGGDGNDGLTGTEDDDR